MIRINGLNHVNIHTSRLEETRVFFADIVGLEVGARPNFANFGYWMYAGGQAVVHLSTIEAGGTPPRSVAGGKGDGFDHLALDAAGLAEMVARLEAHGIDYERRMAGDAPVVQLFFADPNGVTVELGFDAYAEGVLDPAGDTA